MNVKPTELEQFNAAVHLQVWQPFVTGPYDFFPPPPFLKVTFDPVVETQAQIRGFTTKLRIKREIMAERAARKAKAEKLQRFDQLVIEVGSWCPQHSCGWLNAYCLYGGAGCTVNVISVRHSASLNKQLPPKSLRLSTNWEKKWMGCCRSSIQS